MRQRPSALALTVALSRLGAVAVLLRPDGDTRREIALGQVQRIITDPERAAQAAGLGSVHTFVLGGGGGARDLGVSLTTDMERIDVARVRLPKWYRPDPGRAGDLAFILFTGEGEQTRMSRITNRRWVTSAFGTASSAALTADDTVYSVTPLYHASGLMMSVGGAITGGARLAMATAFEPSTFWEEVRRYGVTVATYTWTLLHDLVQAPPGARASATTRCGCSSGRGCRAACGAASSGASLRPGCSSSTPPPTPARSSSTCATPSPGAMGRRLPGEPRGSDRRLRHRRRPAGARRRRVRQAVRDR